MRIGDPSEQPPAERAHEEADGENAGCGEELAGGVAGRKKGRGKIDRGEGIRSFAAVARLAVGPMVVTSLPLRDKIALTVMA
jgi:hypothetical protein